jgi:hypothetical protein
MAPSGGRGSATVTLDNGEVFEFSVICGLEPHEAAGSEILFTAVDNGPPLGFDVTQFGNWPSRPEISRIRLGP